MPHLQLSPTTLRDQVGCKAPEIDHVAVPEVPPHGTAGDQALPSPKSLMTSNESKPSHEEEDAPSEDEDAEAGKGEVEVLSNTQVASDGKDGQGWPQIQNTLTSISHIFGMHEETDAESDLGEKIQSICQKQHQPSPKEDTPSKDLSESSSEEEQPSDKALRDKARQRAWQLDTNFDAW